jgi:hypothetical protein
MAMEIDENEDRHRWEAIAVNTSNVGREALGQSWIRKLLNFEADREIDVVATERVIVF